MVSNYYTLRHIAHDLDRRLSGMILREAFSQERNQLVLMFVPPLFPDNESGTSEFLIISCEPTANYLFLRNAFARAKRNTIAFFPSSAGERVRSVVMHPSDRQITIQLGSSQFLAMQFFGSAANVLRANSDGTVQDAFLRSRESIGKTSLDEPLHSGFVFETPFQIQEQLAKHPTGKLAAALKSTIPTLGSLLVREIFVRTGLESTQNVSELTKHGLADFSQVVSTLLRELKSDPDCRIYYEEEHPAEFSIINLQLYAEHRYERYDSLHEALRRFVGTVRRDRAFVDTRKALLHQLQLELDRTARALENISRDLEQMSRPESYERMGKLLMANLHQLEKGMKSVELDDVFESPPVRLTIPLEAVLTPSRNAERYFEKAKKSRRSAAETAERKKSLQQKEIAIGTLRDLLDDISTKDDLESFVEDQRDHLKEIGIRLDSKTRVKTAPDIPFRVFRISGGFEVWAGKSSANNDLLTMKHAKPNDLWFHARGAGGSHVVLRMGTGKGELSKRAIEEAASIAAYYSKMKNAKTVPVAMTERKYVRKPKGSPVGTVAIEREKILFVEPKLPASPST